jgi:membrane-bound ClpP family serine protease
MTALGVSLLVVGSILIIVEAHVPTLGVLGAPGVLALAVGAVLTVSGVGGGLILGVVTAVLLALVGAGVLVISLEKGSAARRRRVRAGPEGLIGHVGIVRSWAGQTGRVLVDGGLWTAQHSWSDQEEAQLDEGDSIVVERLSGLTLAVRRAEEWELVR